MNKFKPIIGLEVHVELKTKTKMFCSCSADYFGKEPNTHTCPVCLGLPGALPVPNETAIEWCILIGLALNCKVNKFSKFDRKNYFYPDLPKGYQISQYDLPFNINGQIILNNGKIIRIRRVHMEEDTGKLTHKNFVRHPELVSGSPTQTDKITLIDFNRSGVPLVEIVTEPDFTSPTEVKEYLQKLQQIVRYLDVSNADMEKGEMRLEPNISLLKICHPELARLAKRNSGSVFDHNGIPNRVRNDKNIPKYKVEVKNINSFRFVEKAINYEIKRQQELLEKGETPVQETRGWNEIKQKTFSQRTKEEAHDYRYFPEPDIPPVIFDDETISNLKKQMPEMPSERLQRFVKEYSLSTYDAEILIRDITVADYFEEVIKAGKNKNVFPKQIANFVINKKVDIRKSSPEETITLIKQNSQIAQIDTALLDKIITEVLNENQKAVEDFKKGKENVIMFLIGQVMRKLATKADTKMIKEELGKKLKYK